jgi:hypothetical protein
MWWRWWRPTLASFTGGDGCGGAPEKRFWASLEKRFDSMYAHPLTNTRVLASVVLFFVRLGAPPSVYRVMNPEDLAGCLRLLGLCLRDCCRTMQC